MRLTDYLKALERNEQPWKKSTRPAPNPSVPGTLCVESEKNELRFMSSSGEWEAVIRMTQERQHESVFSMHSATPVTMLRRQPKTILETATSSGERKTYQVTSMIYVGFDRYQLETELMEVHFEAY